jgi:hypothetical protein
MNFAVGTVVLDQNSATRYRAMQDLKGCWGDMFSLNQYHKSSQASGIYVISDFLGLTSPEERGRKYLREMVASLVTTKKEGCQYEIVPIESLDFLSEIHKKMTVDKYFTIAAEELDTLVLSYLFLSSSKIYK